MNFSNNCLRVEENLYGKFLTDLYRYQNKEKTKDFDIQSIQENIEEVEKLCKKEMQDFYES
ncbi:MAG: hypothetical protein WCF95_00215 [bacterium]